MPFRIITQPTKSRLQMNQRGEHQHVNVGQRGGLCAPIGLRLRSVWLGCDGNGKCAGDFPKLRLPASAAASSGFNWLACRGKAEVSRSGHMTPQVRAESD